MLGSIAGKEPYAGGSSESPLEKTLERCTPPTSVRR